MNCSLKMKHISNCNELFVLYLKKKEAYLAPENITVASGWHSNLVLFVIELHGITQCMPHRSHRLHS